MYQAGYRKLEDALEAAGFRTGGSSWEYILVRTPDGTLHVDLPGSSLVTARNSHPLAGRRYGTVEGLIDDLQRQYQQGESMSNFRKAVERLCEQGPPELPWEYRGIRSYVYAHLDDREAREWLTWALQEYGSVAASDGGPRDYTGDSDVDAIMRDLRDEAYSVEENQIILGRRV